MLYLNGSAADSIISVMFCQGLVHPFGKFAFKYSYIFNDCKIVKLDKIIYFKHEFFFIIKPHQSEVDSF